MNLKVKKGLIAPRLTASWLWSLLLLTLLASCEAVSIEPPRLATQTARFVAIPTASGTPLLSVAPTPTLDPAPQDREPVSSAGEAILTDSVSVWINGDQQSRRAALDDLAAGFTERTGIDVELVLVSPDLLPGLVQTAVISGSLPDVVLHPIDYSVGWSNDGIIDAAVATEILGRLGRESFDPAALNMLALDDSGAIPALPSDGWQQIILYRKDWFSELDLEPPETFEAIFSAAESLFQPDSIISGIVIPTDSALISTQQAFEMIAAANGCEIIDENGEIIILHPACLEALEFYRSLINQFSPIGVQTDISTLNAYLAGRTGIIFTTPSALPVVANLDEEFKPNCPLCNTPRYLADNSGVITTLIGTGEFAQQANFGQINALGATTSANREAAEAFIEYWFTDGYHAWLALDPESKVPMRRGAGQSPQLFIETWRQLPLDEGSPTLGELYGEQVVEQLAQGVASNSRWGFVEGQGALITRLHEEVILPPLLQEMLSGYFTSSQTIFEIYKAVIDLIPFYAFPVELPATPEP